MTLDSSFTIIPMTVNSESTAAHRDGCAVVDQESASTPEGLARVLSKKHFVLLRSTSFSRHDMSSSIVDQTYDQLTKPTKNIILATTSNQFLAGTEEIVSQNSSEPPVDTRKTPLSVHDDDDDDNSTIATLNSFESSPPLRLVCVPARPGAVELSIDDWRNMYCASQRANKKLRLITETALHENRFLKRQLIQLQKWSMNPDAIRF